MDHHFAVVISVSHTQCTGIVNHLKKPLTLTANEIADCLPKPAANLSA